MRLRWVDALDDAGRAAVRAVIDAARTADGVAPVGEQVLRELDRSRTGHLLLFADDEVAGYLDLAPGDGAPAMAEAVVHPRWRRRGWGAALIAAGLDRGGPGTRVWAHGNLPAARATAAALGLELVRELLQLHRPLAGVPAAAAAPAGVRLRTYAGPGDDAELLRVNNAAFSWHPEQGGWTEEDVAERRAEPWFDPAGLFLAFDSGEQPHRLLGFHWTKVHGPDVGEVYVVGVDPGAQGRGLGGWLTAVGLDHLAGVLGAGATVMLYVEADNPAALATYRRSGFTVAARDAAYTRR